MRIFQRFMAISMAAVYLWTNVLAAHAAESNFWAERRRSAQQAKPSSAQNYLASAAMAPGRNSLSPDQEKILAGIPQISQVNLGTSAAAPDAPRTRLADALTHSVTQKPMSRQDIPAWLSKVLSPYGSVKEIHLAKSANSPFIVHIQDAHGIEEAQRNMANILETVTNISGPDLFVGVEGASGGFDLAPYRDFPDPDITRDVADYFLKEGFIGAPEYAGLTAPKQPTLWGLEDLSLYEGNIQAFKDSLLKKDAAENILRNLKTQAGSLKDKIYATELKEFDRHFIAYKNRTEGLGPYVRYLMSVVLNPRLPKDLALNSSPRLISRGSHDQADFPNLALLLRALLLEEQLDFKKVEQERLLLVESLVRKLSKEQISLLIDESLRYRAGQTSYAEYYQFLRDLCRKNGMDLKQFGPLNDYVDYVLLAEKIDRNKLLDELSRLEVSVQNQLALRPEQKRLVGANRNILLLEKLFDHSMTMADWVEYDRDREKILGVDQELEALSSTAGLTAEKPVAKNPLTSDFIRPFEDFCRNASLRNAAFVDNLLKALPPTKSSDPRLAVLVAGGFHSDGLAEILRKKDISYMVVTPKISEVPKDNDYLDVFARDPLPLEKIFEGEKIYLVYPLSFAGQVSSAFKQVAEQSTKLFIGIQTVLQTNSSKAFEFMTGWVIMTRDQANATTLEVGTSRTLINIHGRELIVGKLGESIFTRVANFYRDRIESPIVNKFFPEIKNTDGWKERVRFFDPAWWIRHYKKYWAPGFQAKFGIIVVLALLGIGTTFAFGTYSAVFDFTYTLVSFSSLGVIQLPFLTLTTIMTLLLAVAVGFYSIIPFHNEWNRFAKSINPSLPRRLQFPTLDLSNNYENPTGFEGLPTEEKAYTWWETPEGRTFIIDFLVKEIAGRPRLYVLQHDTLSINDADFLKFLERALNDPNAISLVQAESLLNHLGTRAAQTYNPVFAAGYVLYFSAFKKSRSTPIRNLDLYEIDNEEYEELAQERPISIQPKLARQVDIIARIVVSNFGKKHPDKIRSMVMALELIDLIADNKITSLLDLARRQNLTHLLKSLNSIQGQASLSSFHHGLLLIHDISEDLSLPLLGQMLLQEKLWGDARLPGERGQIRGPIAALLTTLPDNAPAADDAFLFHATDLGLLTYIMEKSDGTFKFTGDGNDSEGGMFFSGLYDNGHGAGSTPEEYARDVHLTAVRVKVAIQSIMLKGFSLAQGLAGMQDIDKLITNHAVCLFTDRKRLARKFGISTHITSRLGTDSYHTEFATDPKESIPLSAFEVVSIEDPFDMGRRRKIAVSFAQSYAQSSNSSDVLSPEQTEKIILADNPINEMETLLNQNQGGSPNSIAFYLPVLIDLLLRVVTRSRWDNKLTRWFQSHPKLRIALGLAGLGLEIPVLLACALAPGAILLKIALFVSFSATHAALRYVENYPARAEPMKNLSTQEKVFVAFKQIARGTISHLKGFVPYLAIAIANSLLLVPGGVLLLAVVAAILLHVNYDITSLRLDPHAAMKQSVKNAITRGRAMTAIRLKESVAIMGRLISSSVIDVDGVFQLNITGSAGHMIELSQNGTAVGNVIVLWDVKTGKPAKIYVHGFENAKKDHWNEDLAHADYMELDPSLGATETERAAISNMLDSIVRLLPGKAKIEQKVIITKRDRITPQEESHIVLASPSETDLVKIILKDTTGILQDQMSYLARNSWADDFVLAPQMITVRSLSKVEPAGGLYMSSDKRIVMAQISGVIFGHELMHHMFGRWSSIASGQESTGIPETDEQIKNSFTKLLTRFSNEQDHYGLLIFIMGNPLYEYNYERWKNGDIGPTVDEVVAQTITLLLGEPLSFRLGQPGNQLQAVDNYFIGVNEKDIDLFIQMGLFNPKTKRNMARPKADLLPENPPSLNEILTQQKTPNLFKPKILSLSEELQQKNHILLTAPFIPTWMRRPLYLGIKWITGMAAKLNTAESKQPAPPKNPPARIKVSEANDLNQLRAEVEQIILDVLRGQGQVPVEMSPLLMDELRRLIQDAPEQQLRELKKGLERWRDEGGAEQLRQMLLSLIKSDTSVVGPTYNIYSPVAAGLGTKPFDISGMTIPGYDAAERFTFDPALFSSNGFDFKLPEDLIGITSWEGLAVPIRRSPALETNLSELVDEFVLDILIHYLSYVNKNTPIPSNIDDDTIRNFELLFGAAAADLFKELILTFRQITQGFEFKSTADIGRKVRRFAELAARVNVYLFAYGYYLDHATWDPLESTCRHASLSIL